MSNEHRFDEDEQREWEAQEQARLSLGDDALSRRYRVVARSLAMMPRPSLRADFAARVARRAEVESGGRNVLAPFERAVVIALVAAFAAATLIGGAIADVLPSIAAVVREARTATGASWLVPLVLCVVITCLPLSRLRERG